MEKNIDKIAQATKLDVRHIRNVIKLSDEGATIPFISRYRKEMTGSMDEVAIAGVLELFQKLLEVDSRRESILKSIGEQGKLTPELKNSIENAQTLTELEDLYLPYKPKKKTRASIR